MSFKRELFRRKHKDMSKDISELLYKLIVSYRLLEITIHKTPVGCQLTCIPDIRILSSELEEAYVLTAAYMEREGITNITVTRNGDNIEIKMQYE